MSSFCQACYNTNLVKQGQHAYVKKKKNDVCYNLLQIWEAHNLLNVQCLCIQDLHLEVLDHSSG